MWLTPKPLAPVLQRDLHAGFWRNTVVEIESAAANYGKSTGGAGKVLVEYVSANPTRPCTWVTGATRLWAIALPVCCAWLATM